LGTGSKWNNNEIRFSLRSVEKNVAGLGKIFVVGERPEWLINVVHIPLGDLHSVPWRNAYAKTSEVCKLSELSDDFLFMNDDFFILRPIDIFSYPYYYSKQLRCMNNLHRAYPAEILKHWAEAGLDPSRGVHSFAVHRPIRYNKELYLKMPIINKDSLGFSPRSFYANYYHVPGKDCVDPILWPNRTLADYDEQTKDLTDFSIYSGTARDPVFQKWISSLFPNPSIFEK
jgi:hypothetical protein